MTENSISAPSNGTMPEGEQYTTERTAKVYVRNYTNRPMVGVGLSHKYSDDYKDYKSWGIIMPNEYSGPMRVRYRTGFGTTGRDWWSVNWTDGKWHCYSDPHNFRELVDFLEKHAPEVLGKLANIGTQIAIAYNNKDNRLSQDQIDQMGKAAEELTKQLVELLTNNEATAGFKQHILRSEDDEDNDGTWTEIGIHEGKDDAIVFWSRSGISKTNTSWKEIN